MKNCNVQVNGDTLTITINLKEPGTASKTGKSVVIASTEGNVSVPGHEEIKLGINCYKAAPAKGK